MRILKRLAVWLLEMVLQAVLLGLVLIGLYGHDRFSFARGLLIYADSIFVFFFLTGYLLTTAIARAVWKSRTLWLYSIVAAILFVLHFALLNVGLGGAFAPHDRKIVVIAGPVVAFLTTLAGTIAVRRWTAIERSSLEP
jgi:hypothetical protein